MADQLRERRVEVAREILSANKDTGVHELACKIALATKRRISTSTAATIRADILAQIEDERNARVPAETQPAIRESGIARIAQA